MKKLLLYILTLIVLSQFKVDAQTISASSTNGCDSLTVKFTYTPTSLPVTSVKWTFGDGTDDSFEESPQHKYEQPGIFSVKVKINNTDSTENVDYIQIGKTPVANFTSQDTLGFGSLYISFNAIEQETAPFDYSYAWSLSDGTTSNTSHFVHQFDSIGKYNAQLIITDTKGCADTITKTVQVANKVSVPTVFTPNDDSINDLFILEGDGKTTFSIQIFTRSGVKVFENTAKVLVWDGRMFSGEKVRGGIYYYVLKSKDGTQKINQTGFFYIYL